MFDNEVKSSATKQKLFMVFSLCLALIYLAAIHFPSVKPTISKEESNLAIGLYLKHNESATVSPLEQSPFPQSHQQTLYKTHSVSTQKSDTLDLVVRSAFIDLRVRDGHTNSTVILAQAFKEFRRYKLMVGCDVDGHKAQEYTFDYLYFPWIDINHPTTHEDIIIDCYDVQAHNGSRVTIHYRRGPNSTEVITKSIQVTPIMKGDGHNGSVVVCASCFDKPSWLSEWLRYQKALGVDLVHMYVEETFLDDSHNMKTVKPYIEEGFLRMEYRKTYFNSAQIYYHSQLLNYNDCLYRHQQTHHYLMFIDTDDFFVPRINKETNLKYYLQRYLKDHNAAVWFHWKKHFPDCGLLQPPDSLKDGNVTSILRVKKYVKTDNFKYACKPSLLTQAAVHGARRVLKGYKEHVANDNEAYVAHIRLHQIKGLPRNTAC